MSIPQMTATLQPDGLRAARNDARPDVEELRLRIAEMERLVAAAKGRVLRAQSRSQADALESARDTYNALRSALTGLEGALFEAEVLSVCADELTERAAEGRDDWMEAA